MATSTPAARLEARVPSEIHALFKRAAEIEGRTLTDFVVSAALKAAQKAINQAGVMRLSLADQERFANALLSPAPAVPALERAFSRRHKLLGAE